MRISPTVRPGDVLHSVMLHLPWVEVEQLDATAGGTARPPIQRLVWTRRLSYQVYRFRVLGIAYDGTLRIEDGDGNVFTGAAFSPLSAPAMGRDGNARHLFGDLYLTR